jgi:TolB-like protein
MRAITLLFALAIAVPAQAVERQKLAVLDLEAKGVDKATVETLTDIITVSLKKLGVFDVISRADIQQMLNFEESKQLVGCTSNSACIAEIGGALGVAKVVTGSVGKVGSNFVINLSLLDTKSARVLERESRTADNLDKMVAEAEAGARFLVRSLLEGRQGDVIVKVSENNSEVEVDGKLVGLSPMPRMKMASGPHTLRVSKKGFITYAKDVQVDDRETTVLDASLIPSMDYINNYDRTANGMRISAYVTGGVGVAAVATSFILWYGYNDPRLKKHNDKKAAIDAAGGPTDAQKAQINSEADSINLVYNLCYAIGIIGGAAIATSVVLFAVGPKPGIYDQYKTVEVGQPKVSLELSPIFGGGMLMARGQF